MLPQPGNPGLQQHDCGEDAFGTAALESQLGVDLLPAGAFLANQGVGRELDVVENHLVEVGVTGQVADRLHLHTGEAEIDDELGQAFAAILRASGSAHQGDHVVAVVGHGGPDLAPLEVPALLVAGSSGLHTGQVGAGGRLAHANAEVEFAAADGGYVLLALGLGAELEDQRCALAVGDPVGGHRCALGQQLLDHNEAGEGVAATAAVLGGNGQTEPAGRPQFAGEVGIKTHPGTGQDIRRQVGQVLREKRADLAAQGFVLRGDASRARPLKHGASPYP